MKLHLPLVFALICCINALSYMDYPNIDDFALENKDILEPDYPFKVLALDDEDKNLDDNAKIARKKYFLGKGGFGTVYNIAFKKP